MAKDGRLKNGLYQRENSWCIDVVVNGIRRRKSFGSDKKAAQLALAEIKKQQALGKATNDWSGLDSLFKQKISKTFAEAAGIYMAERPTLKPSTIRGYHEILSNYLLPNFGKMNLDQISEEKIAKFQATVAKKVSAVRTNNIMGLLRYILKVCVRRKLIMDNPALGVQPLEEQQPDIDPLTTDELSAVLQNLHPYYRPLFTCLAWTGARPNEMLALRWQDVDSTRNEIHIKKGRVRGHEGVPKTASSKRTVPMSSNVKEILTELKKSPTQHVEGYVFLNKKGQPINKHMDRQWRVALRKAGIKHRPSYQLRHTFASLCLQKGCDPGWLAKVLGHSNLQTTFRHYARFISDASKDNENRLEQAVRNEQIRQQTGSAAFSDNP